jgi:HNH endonuclease
MHKFSITDNIVSVFITQRNGKQHTILLDLEDWDWIKDYGLCVQAYSRSFRAVIYDANSVQHYLHRVILNAPKGLKVDHVDGNGLDNRKEKLVICTQAENLQNRYHLV